MSEELLVSIQKAKSDLAKAIMSGVKKRVEQVRRSFDVYFIYIYFSYTTKNIHLRGILRCACNFLAHDYFFKFFLHEYSLALCLPPPPPCFPRPLTPPQRS